MEKCPLTPGWQELVSSRIYKERYLVTPETSICWTWYLPVGTITASLNCIRCMRPDKDPGVPLQLLQRETAPAPHRVGSGHKQQSQKKYQTERMEIVAPVVGDTKFIHTELLHNQPRYTHPYSVHMGSPADDRREIRKRRIFQLLHTSCRQRKLA